MRNSNSENPNEKIEFILSSLIDFSNNNEFDYSLYKSFAEDSSKSFIRYFSQIEDQTIKEKIISDLHTDFYFIVNDAVTNMLASNQNNGSVSEDEIYISQPIPDNRIRSYESNYMKLKETFLNLVLTEIKPQEPKAIEKEKVEIKPQKHTDYFKDNAFEIWERLFENFNIDKTKRTDLRFMYEIMKHNGQIHKTVTVKSITDWINETYDFGIDKLQYTNIKSKSNENRMSIYNLIK
ncbi:hypothetical protein [uncultured Flavobacterium sp.]|uniref:hypothetical protein n=1 Tax=uncultured Flavobacterium sp. TaxID=165435 RepID=UPI00262685B1|nr:hypothetical protein [uncultured Flavobacterium sp.]